MRVLRFGIAAAFAIAEAVAAIALVVASHHDPDPWLIAGFAITAGLTFVAAGLVALWRRPENATGAWMTATGCLWFVAALSESNDSWVWTSGFVLANLAFAAFGALILAYPDGRLERRDVWLVAVGGIAAVGGNLVVALTDESPLSSRCTSCPGSAIAVMDARTAAEVVTVVCTIVIVAVLALIAATLVQRWRRASVTSRRTLRPVYATCGLALVLLLASVVADALEISGVAYSILWVLFLLSFALVPISFLAGVLRSRFDRAGGGELPPLARRRHAAPGRGRPGAPRPDARDRLPPRRPRGLGRREGPRGRRAAAVAGARGDDDRAQRPSRRRPRARPDPGGGARHDRPRRLGRRAAAREHPAPGGAPIAVRVPRHPRRHGSEPLPARRPRRHDPEPERGLGRGGGRGRPGGDPRTHVLGRLRRPARAQGAQGAVRGMPHPSTPRSSTRTRSSTRAESDASSSGAPRRSPTSRDGRRRSSRAGSTSRPATRRRRRASASARS